MPELGTYGSVRGVPGNGHPYRDHSRNDLPSLGIGLSRLEDRRALLEKRSHALFRILRIQHLADFGAFYVHPGLIGRALRTVKAP